MRAISALYFKNGEVEYEEHASVAAAKNYCRKRYVADEEVNKWQISVPGQDRTIHYTQPPEEKR